MSLNQLPFVTIAVITFNSEMMIGKCLSSIFEVNYPKNRYEVIVVDAGSKDKTQSIVQTFPVDKFIVDKGAPRGKARNICVKEAQGEIVAMIDSDVFSKDYDWLLKAVHMMEDPKVAMVRGSDKVLYPDEDVNFISKVIYFFSLKPSRVLFRRDV